MYHPSTQRLNNILDINMKLLCTGHDDMDFLNYIPQTVPRDTLLVTFDLGSLHTNIPLNLGI